MKAHFNSFTPEAMRAFGQALAAEFEQRRAFVSETRHHTFSLLADFQRQHRAAEAQRQSRAAREADGRRLFVSELRSGVHALRNRFDLNRREMAADLHSMAGELRAASEAFQSRPSPQSRPRGSAEGTTKPADFDGQTGMRTRSGHTEKMGKKRHV